MNENGARKIYDGITHIDEDLLEAAQTKAAPRRSPWARWAVAAACVCFLAAGALALLGPGGWRAGKAAPSEGESYGGDGTVAADPGYVLPSAEPGKPVKQSDSAGTENTATHTLAAYAEVEAALPAAAAFPGENAGEGAWQVWSENAMQRREAARAYDARTMSSFFTAAARQFLSGKGDSNAVCSPANLYLALGMLAEVTEGESRAQILELLGEESVESLRAAAGALWRANYQDDGVTALRLADSLWLRSDTEYTRSTLEALAQYYYASSYRGEMGSPDYDAALQTWLNEQTGGLLEQQTGGVRLDGDTVLALASTIYFKTPWVDAFPADATDTGVFHAPGGDVEREFMHRKISDTTVYAAEDFTAVSLPLTGGQSMWLLLPEEGVSADEVLSGASWAALTAGQSAAREKQYDVHLTMPRFDVTDRTDLIPGLRALGVTDVFDAAAADFTPLTEQADALYVNAATHAARFTADEEGVEGAAYTVLLIPNAGLPQQRETYDFTLDRPFLFVVTGEGGAPLFAGVVNEP